MSLPLRPTSRMRSTMRLTYAHLRRHPRVFRHMTELTGAEFDVLVQELRPVFHAREPQRLGRPLANVPLVAVRPSR